MNKYGIKHKWWEHILYKYRYKKVSNNEIEEAYRFRLIWMLPFAIIQIVRDTLAGLIEGIYMSIPYFMWSDKGSVTATVSYIFDNEVIKQWETNTKNRY